MKPDPYWFPAKRYGWGWGPPACWQGWAFLAGWIGLVIFGSHALSTNTLSALVFLAGMVAVLMLVCYVKGEPPRWRWGNRK